MKIADIPRDPKEIVLEAELLVSSPERIRVWLEERTTGKRVRPFDDHESLERALLERNEPLITLSVARFASSTEVMRQIIDGPARQNKSIRLSALMNEVVAKRGIGDIPDSLCGRGSGELEAFIASLDIEEVMALFGNSTLDNRFLIDFFEQKGPWVALDDTRRFAALRALQSNPRIKAAYSGMYDGHSEYLHNRVFSAAWELAGKVPVTTGWAAHLCSLYEELPKNTRSLDNPLQLAARWIPDRADAKCVQSEQKSMESGNLGVFARVRKGLARGSVVSAHSPDARRALANHDDPAVRAAYYLEAQMTTTEMKEADERDPLLSFNEMLFNRHLWQRKETREELRKMAWDPKRDPKSYMDPQNMFNAHRDAYMEKYPAWFKDDDQVEDIAATAVEDEPSEELQRLGAIEERLASIQQQVITPPKQTWPGTAIAAGIIGGLLVAVFQAFCIAILWDWFVAPVFHVAEMPVVAAYGISMLISIFKDPTQQYKEKDWSELIGMIFGQAVGLSFLLLIGWILHLFV